VTALVITLMVMGSVAELAGIGLIAFEIRSDRRRAAQLVETELDEPPIKTPVGRSLGMAYELDGREPTIEERVANLESGLENLRTTQTQGTQAMQEQLATVVRAAAAELDQRAHARVEEMRLFVRELLTGDLRERKLGVSLLIAGVLLAMAGNILSVLCG
jgi:hypothetical protein